MKQKWISIVGLLLVIGTVQTASAALIVGDLYLDGDGASWEYVGDYNVGDGAPWPNNQNYSALQAAELVFGVLDAGYSYAISTLDDFVDHMAWYDGWGDGTYLPTYNSYGTGQALAEDFFVDVGAVGYTEYGDYSAYIGADRASIGGGAYNHVFVSANVPEPASIILFGLGLAGLALTRKRKASM